MTEFLINWIERLAIFMVWYLGIAIVLFYAAAFFAMMFPKKASDIFWKIMRD